jgi:7,8-dihydropterin-6-yl-methyl-4-(beta-D-ribofuranosyl)aminobenzene 5'-phosphate synthase
MLWVRNQKFRQDINRADRENRRRLASARHMDLPAHDQLDLTVLLDDMALDGFRTAPGISYLLSTGEKSLLFDMGFGDENGAFAHNIAAAEPDFDRTAAVVISHLHPDHMGGFAAVKQRAVPLPKGCKDLEGLPCYLPDACQARPFEARQVIGPQLLPAGIGTTGPLDCSLFFMGPTREQVLLVRLKDKGVVVVTGCGHPTIALILENVARLTPEPVYAVVGGLHLPVTDSPWKKPGLQVQMIFGTGKPPWQRISDRDVDEAVTALNQARVKYLYLSSHDICAHAIRRLSHEMDGEAVCLESGKTYTL